MSSAHQDHISSLREWTVAGCAVEKLAMDVTGKSHSIHPRAVSPSDETFHGAAACDITVLVPMQTCNGMSCTCSSPEL